MGGAHPHYPVAQQTERECSLIGKTADLYSVRPRLGPDPGSSPGTPIMIEQLDRSILLVSGSRHYTDRQKVLEYLTKYQKEINLLICGGAKGADTIAKDMAGVLGIHTAEVKALWDYYNKAAGPIRNSIMLLLRPTAAVIFHENLNESKGTKHMIGLLTKVKIPFDIID